MTPRLEMSGAFPGVEGEGSWRAGKWASSPGQKHKERSLCSACIVVAGEVPGPGRGPGRGLARTQEDTWVSAVKGGPQEERVIPHSTLP